MGGGQVKILTALCRDGAIGPKEGTSVSLVSWLVLLLWEEGYERELLHFSDR